MQTGIQITDLCNLKSENINIISTDDSNYIGKLTYGMGTKYRQIPLNNECCVAILDWLRFMHIKKKHSNYLFVNNRTGKFTRSGIRRIFNKYLIKLGTNITITSLRNKILLNINDYH